MLNTNNVPKVNKELPEIRANLYGHLETVQDEYSDKGWLPTRLNLNKGVIRGLIEIYAWGSFQLYNLLQKLLQQVTPRQATDKWLEMHADSVGLKRRQATKARGLVRFKRSQTVAGNINILGGRIVRTKPDGSGEVYRYVSLQPTVLPMNAEHVDVLVEAETFGTVANVTVGQICELATPVMGIASVNNEPEWLTLEGADTETDAQLAERCRLQWLANNGCTKYAYMAWALGVPGVTSVSILDQHPRGQGTVDIVVRGADNLPTEALLAKVREAIAPHTPINDDWLVKAPVAVPLSLELKLWYVQGDEAWLKARAMERISSLFAGASKHLDIVPLQIGQDVTLALLTHVVMGLGGLKSVSFDSPKLDVTVPADGIARLHSLNISILKVAEA